MTELERLASAIGYFQSRGFISVDVPYEVDQDIQRLTAPDKTFPSVPFDRYVGSAEQSFLTMRHLPARCMALTPCVRVEEKYDHIHLPVFIKLELRSTDLPWRSIRDMCYELYSSWGHNPQCVGGDIEINGVEVGSYGERLGYAFGTGLAEPRFGRAIK